MLRAEVRPTKRSDAWQKVADGLQINRYFIHVEPQMRQRRRRLLELTGMTDERTPIGLLECMWALFGERGAGRTNPWSSFAFAPSHSASAPLTIDMREGSPSPAPSRCTVPGLVEEAQHVLEGVGLSFLPQLLVDCVVISAQAESPSWAAQAFGTTVLGQHDDSAVRVAERLLRSAAAQLLWCSYVWPKRPSALEPEAELVWDGLMPRASYARLENLYVLCMVLRLKSGLRADARFSGDDAEREIATLEADLQGQCADLFALLAESRSVRVRDLIVPSYPCEARFQQFLDGLGPGQSA